MQAKIQLAQTVLCHEDIEGPLQNESFAKVPFCRGVRKLYHTCGPILMHGDANLLKSNDL